MASSAKVDFVRQQGFRDASPTACAPQFSSLLFQPRVVGPVILVGLWLQTWWLFAGLAAVLWWNALVPRLNPFDVLYNRLLAGREGRLALPPAPPPRRFAQGMAAALATLIAVALASGWQTVAWAAEALLVAAFAALLFGKFCLGSFVYYHLRGEGAFARRTTPWAAALLLGLAAAALAASPAEAQNRVGFEGRAGMGLPAFDLADIVDAGPAVGLDLTYALGERGALLLGGDVEFLKGREPGAVLPSTPDLTAWHYAVGVEVQLLAPRTTYWRLRTGGGIGGSTYDAEGGGSESALSVFGNLELGYKFSSEADFFVGLKGWVAFPDEPEAGVPSPGPLAGLDETAWSFPVTAGLRFDF